MGHCTPISRQFRLSDSRLKAHMRRLKEDPKYRTGEKRTEDFLDAGASNN